MPIVKLFPAYAGNSTMSKYPTSKTHLAILREENTTSYVYVANGYSDFPVSARITVNFGSNEVAAMLPSGATINSCKFTIVHTFAGDQGLGTEDGKFSFALGNTSMITRSSSSGTNTATVTAATNPVTKTAWKTLDFAEDFVLTLTNNTIPNMSVYYLFVEITYSAHEVLQTPLGYIKTSVQSGIISLPFFAPNLISYSALRISTSKGTGAFSLVATTDSYASPIRISTPKGIRAIAYKK